MNVKNIIWLSSRKVVAQVHKDDFSCELPEIERVAELIGHYGNIASYKTEKSGNIVNIVFEIADPNFKK